MTKLRSSIKGSGHRRLGVANKRRSVSFNPEVVRYTVRDAYEDNDSDEDLQLIVDLNNNAEDIVPHTETTPNVCVYVFASVHLCVSAHAHTHLVHLGLYTDLIRLLFTELGLPCRGFTPPFRGQG